MGNLALHSAEEPDDLRATTGTVEVPTIRDNDAALALGARPIQQHEPAARQWRPTWGHGKHRRSSRLCFAYSSEPGPAWRAPSSLRRLSERLRSRDCRRSRSLPEGIARSRRGIARLDSYLPGLSLCKAADGTGCSSVDDTRAFRISDPEHRCEREHLGTQSNDRASRKARTDTRIAEERQTGITVSPIVSQRASP